MYKFLMCAIGADNNEIWYYSTHNKMYPECSNLVKEAILIGYYSRAKEKWITNGTAIQLVSDYKKVKRALPDTELILITLRVTKEAIEHFNSNDNAYNHVVSGIGHIGPPFGL